MEGGEQHEVVEQPVADRPAEQERVARAQQAPRLARALAERHARPCAACRPRPSDARALQRASSGTAAISATDSTAGSRVSRGERSGPTPRNMTTPSTATATKLTELLMSRKATLRRAIVAAGIPRAAEDPRAEGDPAGAAGRDDRADGELREADLRARAPRHPAAEHRLEHRHVGQARGHLQPDADRQPAGRRPLEPVASPLPGRGPARRPARRRASAAATPPARRQSRRRSNSRGIGSAPRYSTWGSSGGSVTPSA